MRRVWRRNLGHVPRAVPKSRDTGFPPGSSPGRCEKRNIWGQDRKERPHVALHTVPQKG